MKIGRTQTIGYRRGKGYNFQFSYVTGIEKQPKRANAIRLPAIQGK